MEEIKAMSKTRFTIILKKRITDAASKYRLKKQGKKGGEIKYTGIHMASYLQPYSSTLKINEKQEIFSIRNKMVNIPANFATINECICGNIENSANIYDCQKLNNEQPKIEYEEIHSENMGKIRNAYERFKRNINERENTATRNIRPLHVNFGGGNNSF